MEAKQDRFLANAHNKKPETKRPTRKKKYKYDNRIKD